MIQIRRADERGQFDHGWLKTCHTFSFGDYRDPQYHQFRALRVINEDWVAPGQGFGEHPHRDMEIVTCVLEGQLEHRDSMGNGEVLRPGEFQRMTAGRGVTHSEFNPSAGEPVHLYQIWLFPERRGLDPGYEQKPFPVEGRRHQWQLVASPDGEGGSLTIHQDARIHLASLRDGEVLDRELAPGRHAWLQVLRGEVSLGDRVLRAGDGVAFSEEARIPLRGVRDGEVMLFDLA